ncbi:MAG: hypothetical protein M0Z95_24175 [Actinomycetota bacterium]|jgi:hypothetical protein|nr:hypothetical protein [Actinomycetota bacterium]
MAEFDHLPEAIQASVIDGHRPLRAALEATVAEALEDQPTRDPALVLALIDALAAAATRQAASGVTAQLRSEPHDAVLALALPRSDVDLEAAFVTGQGDANFQPRGAAVT